MDRGTNALRVLRNEVVPLRLGYIGQLAHCLNAVTGPCIQPSCSSQGLQVPSCSPLAACIVYATMTLKEEEEITLHSVMLAMTVWRVSHLPGRFQWPHAMLTHHTLQHSLCHLDVWLYSRILDKEAMVPITRRGCQPKSRGHHQPSQYWRSQGSRARVL